LKCGKVKFIVRVPSGSCYAGVVLYELAVGVDIDPRTR